MLREVGVPYDIVMQPFPALIVGSYVRDLRSSPPADHTQRKKKIPLSDITRYQRIELSDNL